MKEGFAHSRPVEANVKTRRRALQGHHIVAGGNAPGKLVRKPTDPGGVAEARAKALCLVAISFLFDPFRVGHDESPFSGGVAPGYFINPLRGFSEDL